MTEEEVAKDIEDAISFIERIGEIISKFFLWFIVFCALFLLYAIGLHTKIFK